MLSFFEFFKPLKAPALFLLFFAVSGLLFASPDLKYELENRVVQYIDWPAQEDALRYELVIERDDGGVWTPVLSQTTEETTLKTSLNAGKYRYRVDVWDLLGRRRPSAPWANLVILKAMRPVLEKIQPDSVNLLEGGPWRITVTGENIAEDSEAFLSRPNGTQIRPDKWTVQNDGKSGRLEFSSLDEGVFSIIVQNPGSMEASMPNFYVHSGNEGRQERERKFMFSLGYNMLWTLTGGLVHGEYGNYLHSEYYPVGALGRLSFLPFRGKPGALGFELSPSWNWMESENYDPINNNYSVAMHLLGLSLGVAYQTPFFFRHLAFIARAGGGIAMGYQLEVRLEERVTMQPFWGFVSFVEGGLAFQFLINQVFFLEAGANYVMIFSASNSTYIRPAVSIGWNF
jgi:hypothetical protein